MIDDKKIEEAAFDLYKNSKLDFVSSESVEGFKEGAKWAISEFLKNLWHDHIGLLIFVIGLCFTCMAIKQLM